MNTIALADHLAALNAKTAAWIAESPETRGAGMICEDLAHWAEYGVHTVEDFQRYVLEANIWHAYKSVHGIRPRWLNFKAMSIEELQQKLDALDRDVRSS